MPENGSINGGAGRDTGGIGRGDDNNRGGQRERTEQKEKFDKALNDSQKAKGPKADDRDGLPPSDTTPDYTGPTPDPRGPALSDRRDRHEDDKPNYAKPGPGDMPPSDTTPGDYTGPNPDPRGPALSDPSDKDEGERGNVVSMHDVFEIVRETFDNFMGKKYGGVFTPRTPQDLIRTGDPHYDIMSNNPFDPMHTPSLQDMYDFSRGGGGSGMLIPKNPYDMMHDEPLL